MPQKWKTLARRRRTPRTGPVKTTTTPPCSDCLLWASGVGIISHGIKLGLLPQRAAAAAAFAFGSAGQPRLYFWVCAASSSSSELLYLIPTIPPWIRPLLWATIAAAAAVFGADRYPEIEKGLKMRARARNEAATATPHAAGSASSSTRWRRRRRRRWRPSMQQQQELAFFRSFFPRVIGKFCFLLFPNLSAAAVAAAEAVDETVDVESSNDQWLRAGRVSNTGLLLNCIAAKLFYMQNFPPQHPTPRSGKAQVVSKVPSRRRKSKPNPSNKKQLAAHFQENQA